MSQASFEEKVSDIMQNVPADEIPPWAAALISCFNEMVSEFKTISSIVSKVTELESVVSVQKTVTSALRQENKRLCDALTKLEVQVDNNEQHDRNINLLIHGVPEGEGEDTTKKFVAVLNEKMAASLKVDDIARSHRLGRFNPGREKPRPIIARFRCEMKKIKTFRMKKGLKGKGVLLSENLTSRRMSLMNKARDQLGPKNVWTNEGRIFTCIEDKFVEIYSEQVLEDLAN